MQNTIFNTKVLWLRDKSAQADPGAICTATLADLLLTDKWKNKVEAVRQEADPERQKALKLQLPVLLPSLAAGSTLHPWRPIHSGFVVLDLDAKDNPDVEGFDTLKERIAAVPYVAYCGKSCRGKGWLMLVPISDTTRHREIYRALLSDFQQIGLRLDPTCVNLNRLRFASFDPDPYVNTGAVPYGKILEVTQKQMKAAEGRELTDAETDARLLEILEQCDARQLDITGSRKQWIDMLIALASTYGEAGRAHAHRLSQHYPGYSVEETDREYSDLLKRPEYTITMGTFFYYARKALGQFVFEDALVEEETTAAAATGATKEALKPASTEEVEEELE